MALTTKPLLEPDLLADEALNAAVRDLDRHGRLLHRWPDAAATAGIVVTCEYLAGRPSATPREAAEVAHRVWDLLRDKLVPSSINSGPRVRPVALELRDAGVSAPTGDLQPLVVHLLEAGDIATTLRAKIAALEGVLAKIEHVLRAGERS